MGYYITEPQKKVLEYLKANPDWHGPTHIGMTIGGKPMNKASQWALRILKSRALEGFVEKGPKGKWRYREKMRGWTWVKRPL